MSPRVLLDVFVPPEGMVGHSAVLVAMTGAEDFLEDAMQRFTGLRPRQRAELGSVLAYLMLDGRSSFSRQEVFPPGRIPGLHEFYPRSVNHDSLLHAKVALLAFAASRTGAPVHIRLAVLTANFTYTSARQQLELVWAINVPLDGTARREDCADVAAAGAFVETLLARRFYRDEQDLARKRRRLTSRLDVLLEAASSLSTPRIRPRFIHSLDRSLYDQIQDRFRGAIRRRRNFLLCGSGFYEEPSREGGKPVVFDKLENLCALTSQPYLVALVEPSEGGAVAGWARAGETDGWTIVRPVDALNHNRRLHAKFVYVGYLRDEYVSNGRLYLGSGNLSRRGILTHGEMSQGNVETGVVFDVVQRFAPADLKDSLFWAGDQSETVGGDDWAVGQIGDVPQPQPILKAPPVLSAMIEQMQPRRLCLRWREDDISARVSISWIGREWFEAQRADDVSLKDDENPAALHVRDLSGRKWVVPVVDLAGRVGWQARCFDTYTAALEALLDFPVRPVESADDDDGTEDGERDENGRCEANGGGGVDAVEERKIYALHAAAELIEKVAALQATLPKQMIDDWIDHLDRMFHASFPDALIAAWRGHRINLFAHLREPQLRSPHMTQKQRIRYFNVLDRAARAWGLQ